MKYILSIFISVLVLGSQAQTLFQFTSNLTNTTGCAPSTVTPSGTTSIRYNPGDGNSPCPGSSVRVELQRFNGSSWIVLGNQTINTGSGQMPYSFPPISTSGEYRTVGFPSVGGSCSSSGITTNFGTSATITINTAPTAVSFKVNGTTVNPSTFTQVFNCTGSLLMDNIIYTGTATGYEYKVEITKVGSAFTYPGSWILGTIPTTLPLKDYITTTWGASNIGGQYTITLRAKNSCNATGVSYIGKVQVNLTPTACIQLANGSGTGCTGTGVTLLNLSDNFASATTTCSNSPKLNAACSKGQWVGGNWSLLVYEFNPSGSFVKTVVNSTGSLTNTNDISCLNLNDISNPLGYFYTNPTGNRYLVQFTVSNSCGAAPAVGGWFIDNTSGCKTDGEEVTDIYEQDQEVTFSVYPNPATSEVNVVWHSLQTKNPTIRLFSLDGKQIEVPQTTKGLGNTNLNVTGLD